MLCLDANETREGVMEMYWLKACPRCRGDLHEEKDSYGEYVACIQCGYVLNTRKEEALRLTGVLERAAIIASERAA